mgnify:FL=1
MIKPVKYIEAINGLLAFSNQQEETIAALRAELDTRRENLDLCQKRLITTETERNTYRAALEEIHINYGKVCTKFELCEHPACASSYGAWAVADEVLRAITRVTDEPANQYAPWVELGITETQYYKRLYLEMSNENARLTAECEAAAELEEVSKDYPHNDWKKRNILQDKLTSLRAARVQAAAPGTGEA